VTDFAVPLPPGTRRRSHVVLWSSVAVAAVIAAFIAVLASSKQTGSSTASPLIGHAAPAIAGKELSGSGQASLSEFGGKWVLVNFAASWCIPCRDETPQLEQFAQEHAVSGSAVVLQVAYDPGDLSNLAAYLKSVKATWPALNDGQAVVEYGVSGIPQSFLVDPEGTVVASWAGEIKAQTVDAVLVRVPGG
jgi:cytochrome c biogenesis protein CcmG, thiol:disulfide interchange protein DsbE